MVPLPTDNFISLCQQGNYSQDQINSFWQLINKNTIVEFFSWLINHADLSIPQLKQLDNLFNQILDQESVVQVDLMELLKPVLTKKQIPLVQKKLSQMYLMQLDSFFTELKKRINIS